MNDKLIKMFSDLSLYEESLKSVFPAKAYKNAITILKNLPVEVTDIEQLKPFKGFGKGLIEKVLVSICNVSFYVSFKIGKAVVKVECKL